MASASVMPARGWSSIQANAPTMPAATCKVVALLCGARSRAVCRVFAQPLVGRLFQSLIGCVPTRPGFNAGVQIQHIVLLAPGDQVNAADFDRQIQQHIARLQVFCQQCSVVVWGEGLQLQGDAHSLRHRRPIQISRPSRDARGLYPQSLNQQRCQALTDSAKADEKEAGCEVFQG